jgi:hypothetical protein
MACPKCKGEGPFQIEVWTWMTVYDDGTDFTGGDTDWDGTSECRCVACGFFGTVKDLRIENWGRRDSGS